MNKITITIATKNSEQIIMITNNLKMMANVGIYKMAIVNMVIDVNIYTISD